MPATSPDSSNDLDPRQGGEIEPRENHRRLSIPLLLGIALMTAWAVWYIATYSGDFRADVLDERPGITASDVAFDDADVDILTLGRRIYTIHCMACHQIDGRGLPGQYPPLAGSDWVAGRPERLARIVLHGLHGEVVVNGETYNGEMPAHGSNLSDRRIAAVLTYIRSSWGNDFYPVDESLVEAIRRQHLIRRVSWTQAELEALEAEADADAAAQTQPAEPRQTQPSIQPATQPSTPHQTQPQSQQQTDSPPSPR